MSHERRDRFLVVGLNPTLQNTFVVPSLRVSQVNRTLRNRVDVAGKGANTARMLSQLGERAVHLTFGGGRHRDLYMELSIADGIETECIECDVEIRYCHTVIGQDDATTTEIVEPGSRVSRGVEDLVMSRYQQELPRSHTVVIGGTHAPGFSDEVYTKMVRLAREEGLRTVLDIRGPDLVRCLPYRPSAIKINVAEFSHTFTPGYALDEDVPYDEIPRELFDAMIRIRSETGSEVVLTNGAQPVLIAGDRSVESVLPARVTVVNTIGSGDAVTAGLAAGLHRGMRLVDAVQLGLDCAAQNVAQEKPGTLGGQL